MLKKIEDYVIRKYGFEQTITIVVFTITEKIRKIFHLGVA